MTVYIKPVEPMSITNLYDKVAQAMGLDPGKVAKYDCTKLSVATDLQDAVRGYYHANCKSDPDLAFGMDWLYYGPKADSSVESGHVVVEDGFIKVEE